MLLDLLDDFTYEAGRLGVRRRLQPPANTQDPNRDNSRAPTSTDGTIAILIVVSILFCCVWFPGMCRRRCANRSQSPAATLAARQRRSHDAAAVANIVRQSLDIQRRARGLPSLYPRPYSVEQRRALLEDKLATKHVIVDSVLWGANQKSNDGMVRHKDDLIIPAAAVIEESANASSAYPDTDSALEPCAICLTNYKQGDEICWAQSEECPHVFHRACILEWLLRHDECPCCRNDFLEFDDETRMRSTDASNATSTQTGLMNSEPVVISPQQEAGFLLALNAIHHQIPRGAPPRVQAEIFRGLVEIYFPQIRLDTEQGLGQNAPNAGLELPARLRNEGVMLDASDIVLEEDEVVLDDEEQLDVEAGLQLPLDSGMVGRTATNTLSTDGMARNQQDANDGEQELDRREDSMVLISTDADMESQDAAMSEIELNDGEESAVLQQPREEP